MSPSIRDDRVLPEVRVVAALIVLVLLRASAVLYGSPERVGTEDVFAWRIAPAMTPLLMGAGYLGGAWFFARALFSRGWHFFGNGFLAITVFVWFMGVATLLHVEKYAPYSSFSFYAWAILYAVTPFLIPFLWLRNRVTDPGTPDPDDVIVPIHIRLTDRVVGTVLLVVSVLIFIFAREVAAATKANPAGLGLWPWALTPLSARVIAGWFALPGVVGLVLSAETRWSGWRIMLESQILSLVLILLGAARAWGNFRQDSLLTWVFVIGMSALLVSLGALYVSMERRRGRLRVALAA
jgi:hypothetical protein